MTRTQLAVSSPKADEVISSDVAILDLLRKTNQLTVRQMAAATGVTATAVRQRLTRLLAQGLIERKSVTSGRGRPSHHYALTTAGRRKTGANFVELALALWQEVRSIQDVEVRRGLLQRLSKRMAEHYAAKVTGETLAERMESLAALFRMKRIPFIVDRTGSLPVLKAEVCPYPDLAEQDPSICALERLLFEEVLGEDIRLSACRLDGQECCQFESRRKSTERVPAEPRVNGLSQGASH